MMTSWLANSAWLATNRRHHRRFAAALASPRLAQANVLASILQRNAGCNFGKRHDFDRIDSIDAFRRRVPLADYETFAPDIERIRCGEHGVLTAEPVTRLVPTTGSNGPIKLIPWTRTLQHQFNRAIGAWVVDLYHRHPNLQRGPAYWSISPAMRVAHSSAIPVGFDDDTQYLGAWAAPLVRWVMAVPGDVRLISDIEVFRYVTLRCLLAARELRLISVWHPSFFTLMLDALDRHREQLIHDVHDGTLHFRPQPARAREIERGILWPRLQLVSCWTDGAAAPSAHDLKRRLSPAIIQPKGLISTEAFVSLPFANARPIAIQSHFFEFIDAAGESRLIDELEAGATYSVVVTTGGGLYRYQLHDLVEVTGFVARTPSIRFVARDNNVSDLCGEKLSEPFVAAVLQAVMTFDHRFAMLAADDRQSPPGYTLYVESDQTLPAMLSDRVDQALMTNPHYRYGRDLGQLGPVRVFAISGGAAEAYIRAAGGRNTVIGQIKPVSLHRDRRWTSLFAGRYVDDAAARNPIAQCRQEITA